MGDLKFKDLPKKVACIPFFFDIGPPRAQDIIRLCGKLVADEGAEALYLAFCTPGGLVNDGLAVLAMLRTMGVPIVTHNLAHIASAGLPVFMAGDLRLASPGSAFFFHRVGSLVATDELIDVDSLASHTREWEGAEKRIAKAMTARGFRADAAEIMKARQYMTPESAVTTNLAHEVRDFQFQDGWTIWRIT